ncbi:hypothetical protein E2C01_059240 [Portunus trituberculatus]|uniref:Uncharacterized protein n=1 Tax=Portunus trituberculatus TaxID=210409 RepID=A0A5B7H203_PORTR|nr:hypothetical protein [Portunus trituberculatus]
MGSDHLPVIIAFPSVPPPPPTSRRPRWSFKKGNLAQCKRVILDEKRSSWASFCASLSFSTSVSRAWSFFRKVVHPQPPFTFPLTSNGVLTTDAKKLSVLPPTSTQHLALQILCPHLCYPLSHTPAMKLALL